MFSLVFIFLSTVRTNVVGDYWAYKQAYEIMIDVDVPFWRLSYIPFELGYSLLMYLVKSTFGGFHFFLFIQASVVVILQYKVTAYWCECFAIKTPRRKSYELTAYFILWTLYIGHIFSIRNTLAILICLYAMRFVHEKKIIKFVVTVLLASMIHISVLVFFPIYILYWINLSFRVKLLGVIGAIVLFNQFASVIIEVILKLLPKDSQNKVLAYLTGGLGYGSGRDNAQVIVLILLKAIVNVGVIIFILFLIDRYKKRRMDSLYHRAENAYVTIYCTGAVLQVVSSFINLAFSRISTPFIYFQFPLFLVFVKTFDRTKWKSIAFFFLIFYISLRFFINISLDGNSYIPFRTIWSEIL